MNKYIVIGRLTELLNKVKGVNVSKKVIFPDNMNGYQLITELNFKNSLSGYCFARYKKGTKSAIAKAWFGTNKDSKFYGLQNEISVYKTLNKNLKSKTKTTQAYFNVPKLLTSIKNNNSIIMLTEEIIPTENISIEKAASVYKMALSFLDNISVEKDQKYFDHISLMHIIIFIPLLSFYSFIKIPKLRKQIIAIFNYFIRNMRFLFNSNWNNLVHRDLRGSILKSGKNYYVVDWQLAALSNRMIDISQLIVTHYNGKGSTKIINSLLKTAELTNKKELFNLLLIYSTLVEITFVKTKHINEEKNLLKMALSN